MKTMHALALLPAVLILAACGPKAEPVADVRPVRVTKAIASDGQAGVAFAGEIRARYETDMSFRVSGKILSREVDTGAMVKKGQVLARIDAQDANLNAAAARANLAAADSELEFAKAELTRYEDLLAKKFVSQGVYDQKLNAYKAALAKRDSAKAQASVSGNQAAYTTLVADADGVVTAVIAEPGQVVSAGQPVVRVARLGEKDAVINVAESQVALIKGQPAARIGLWSNPGKVYAGTVREFAAAADPVTRTYAVKVRIDDADDALRWGMSATVGFAIAPSTAAAAAAASRPATTIVLPSTALTQTDDKSGGKPAVWVVGADNKVKLVPVQVGVYAEQGVTVLAGLSGGETVVTAGVHKLQAGQLVKPLPPEGQEPRGAVATPVAQVDAPKVSN